MPQFNQLREDRKYQHLKRWFFIKAVPSIFPSITLHQFKWFNATSSVFPALKSTSHFLSECAVSRTTSKLLSYRLPDHTKSKEWYHQHRQLCYKWHYLEGHQCNIGKCRINNGALRHAGIYWIFLRRLPILGGWNNEVSLSLTDKPNHSNAVNWFPHGLFLFSFFTWDFFPTNPNHTDPSVSSVIVLRPKAIVV